MPILVLFLAAAIVTGCATHHSKPPAPAITPDVARNVGDSIATYAASLYPPATTQLHLPVPADAQVGEAVSSSLAHRGFAVSDATGGPGTPLDYTVQPLNVGALVQVVTPGRVGSCKLAGVGSCAWTVRVEQ